MTDQILIQRHGRCRLTVTESAPFGQPSRDFHIATFKHFALQMFDLVLVICQGIVLECSYQLIRLQAIRLDQYKDMIIISFIDFQRCSHPLKVSSWLGRS